MIQVALKRLRGVFRIPLTPSEAKVRRCVTVKGDTVYIHQDDLSSTAMMLPLYLRSGESVADYRARLGTSSGFVSIARDEIIHPG